MGHYSFTNLRKNDRYQYERIYKNLVQFSPFVLKILSRNEILTSNKGHNSSKKLRKMTINNPNQDLVKINACIKFGKILSICSQDIG